MSWVQQFQVKWQTASVGGTAVAAGQTGTSTTGLGPGWKDIFGGRGSVSGSPTYAQLTGHTNTSPYFTDIVARPAGETTQNQRVRVVIPPFVGTVTTTSPVWWFHLRYQATSGDAYMFGLNAGSTKHDLEVWKLSDTNIAGGGTMSVTQLTTGTSIGTYDQTKYYVLDASITSSGLTDTISYTGTVYTGDPDAGGTAGTVTTWNGGTYPNTVPASGAFSDVQNAGSTALNCYSTSAAAFSSFTSYSDSTQIPTLSSGAITANATTATSITPQLASISGGTAPYSTLFYWSATSAGTIGTQYTQIGTAVAGANPVANAAATGLSPSTNYFLRAVVSDSGGLTLTVPSTSTGTQLTTNPANSISVDKPVIPANHNGNITINVTGSGTAWTAGTPGTPNFTLTGGSGYTKVSQMILSTTSAQVIVSVGAVLPSGTSATGPITLSDGTLSTSITVTTPTLAISPTSGGTGTAPTLALTGVGTLWSFETAAGLFTESGGTGASIATPTGITNLAASAVLTVGSAGATLTITDSSTGATAFFTANAGTLAIAYPLAEPASTLTTISPVFTWSGGTANYQAQIYRSTTANFTAGVGNLQATVTGITGLTYTYPDSTGLVVGTVYYYKATITDAGSNTASTSYHVAGTLLANNIILGLLGDSITAGANIDTTVSAGSNIVTSVGSANSPTKNIGVSLAAALQSTNAFRSVTYITANVGTSGQSNQGVSGRTSTDVLAAIATAETNWNAMSTPPNLFSVMIGTNDVRTDKRGSIAIPGAIGTAGTYADNMQRIVANLLTNYTGCKVFLHYPPYFTPNGASSGAGSTIIFDETSVNLIQTSIRTAIDAVVASFAGTNPGQVFNGDKGAAFTYFAERYSNGLNDGFVQEQYSSGQTFFLHPNQAGAANLGRIHANAIYNALYAPAGSGTTTTVNRRTFRRGRN